MVKAKIKVSPAAPIAAQRVIHPANSISANVVSNTVATIANNGTIWGGANEFTSPVYKTKLPHPLPCSPQNPSRLATGDKKFAAVASRNSRMARS